MSNTAEYGAATVNPLDYRNPDQLPEGGVLVVGAVDESQILGIAQRGFVTGPGGEPFGSVGIIINCPIVSRLS